MEPIYPIAGVQLSAICSGLKKSGNDMALITLCAGSHVAMVTTKNSFCAAPVVVAREHIKKNKTQCLLINSGNANAATGQEGIDLAQECCSVLGQIIGVEATQILPFSTGVIGQLPSEKLMLSALPLLVEKLEVDAWSTVAQAIMTTDIYPKVSSRCFNYKGQDYHITGIAKGSGMIQPNMATMLAFVATDMAIEADILQKLCQSASDQSFNRISVDSDTSTNDACVLMASGAAGNQPLSPDIDKDLYDLFEKELLIVYQSLAKSIVRDGEGATKFIEIKVQGSDDKQECLAIAYGVANSPLVKTALFASDPNWGRILMAIGKSSPDGNMDKMVLTINDLVFFEKGQVASDYDEQQGVEAFSHKDISININLNRGNQEVIIWTCDFSYDYIKINAEYRS